MVNDWKPMQLKDLKHRRNHFKRSRQEKFTEATSLLLFLMEFWILKKQKTFKPTLQFFKRKDNSLT